MAAHAASNETIWQPKAHIPQLDGIRGLAILLVTLYRFGQTTPDDGVLGHSLASIFHCGLHGVELFFVLSGFLITGILIETKSATGYFSNFMARRALRIFPLYFATLAVLLIVFPTVARLLQFSYPFELAQSHQLYLWTYTTNIAMSVHDSWMFGWLDHFWSLAVEEHFYLLWPVVVLWLTNRQLLWLSLAGALLATATRIAWIGLGLGPTAPMVLTIFRCDGLLMGAALAVLIRDRHSLSADLRILAGLRIDYVMRQAWLPAIVAAISIDLTGRRLFTLGESLWTVVWCSLLWNIMTATQSSWQGRLFRIAPLRFLGKISYGMYVFQNPLIPLTLPCLLTLGLHYATEGRVIEHLICMLVLCAVTVLCAWISWHGFEKHWLRWKRYFEPQREPRNEARSQAAASEEADRNLPTTMLRLGG